MSDPELRTQRLLLRRWRPEDAEPMAAINRDPEVTRFLNRAVDDAAVAAFHGQMLDHWQEHRFGLYALESTETETAGAFLGFAGFAHLPPFLAEVSDAPELGWRLGREAWGRGLATEAARATLAEGLAARPAAEVISVIHPENERSRSVATKLGMHRDRSIPNPLLRIDTDIWTLPPSN